MNNRPDNSPGGRAEHGSEEPTADKPLNGPRRPVVKPLVLLVLFIAVLVGLYIFGTEVLVPAK